MAKQLEDSFFDEPAKPVKPKAKIKPRKPKHETPAIAEPETKPSVVFKRRSNVVDYDLADAIRILDHEGMLSPDAVQEFEEFLSPYHDNPALAQRVTEWRERNATK